MARELLKDLIYGEQIVSDGSKVDYAVGMTYSLNLEAMLTVPLAFGDLGELDSEVRKSPAFLLEGIRRASDKIVLFCNKGGIHVPKESKTVFSLLEDSIFEVQNETDVAANFHPKLWLVKETDKEGVQWLKLAVMSRNLDFSTCLDICCSIRGKIGGRRSSKGMKKHKPLKDMLICLSDYADKSHAQNVVDLAECLDYVDRFMLDSPFQTEDHERGEEEGYDFFPMLFGKEPFVGYSEQLQEIIPGERVLIISPFIDKTTLTWLTKRKKDFSYESKNTILVTRKEYVTQGVFDLFDEVWVPNDTMVDNTTAVVDLHAKMYLTHRVTGNDLGYTLYLGSANATRNAFNCNGEFLLRLHYKRTTNDRIKEMLDEITSDHQFILMDAPNPEASDERPREKAELELKKAIGCLKNAKISQGENELYNIVLSIKGKYNSNIKIRPLQCQNYWKPFQDGIAFTELKTCMLSEFYVISIPIEGKNKDIEMVAKVKTFGMPANRDESIYQSIVTRKEELLDYVAFMLSDRPAEFLFEQQLLKKSNKYTSSSVSNYMSMPLYEQLLRKASSNPEQIVEVQKFIKKMKPDIVPAELTQMLSMFQTVSKQIDSL